MSSSIKTYVNHIWPNLNFILSFHLSQRDGNPVFPGQKNISFLNNNVSSKVSSGMNGMLRFLATCKNINQPRVRYCSVHLLWSIVLGFLKEGNSRETDFISTLCPLEVGSQRICFNNCHWSPEM